MNNYFKFFGMEESFDIDLSLLRKIYIANSKKFHPDYHTLESEEEQNKVLELSTLNNEAWKTLSDRNKRIAHILDINQAMPEEGKAQVPQDFLMDMMDINEGLMELKFDEDPAKKDALLSTLDQIVQDIEKEGNTAMSTWNDNRSKEALLSVRDYYLKLKYIIRIKEQLSSQAQ